MSKQQKKGNTFPPLQKRIVLHLAQNKPQTINETMKGIKSHNYKSTWIAVDVLKKKGLIEDVATKDYRGNTYPCFWLTERGIFLAISKGAKQETLLRTTLETYPKNKDIQFLIEAAPILGENAFEVLYLTALNGQIEQADVFSILAKQMQKPLNDKEIDQFIAVLDKYPKTHQLSVDYVNQITKNLRKISNKLSINQKDK